MWCAKTTDANNIRCDCSIRQPTAEWMHKKWWPQLIYEWKSNGSMGFDVFATLDPDLWPVARLFRTQANSASEQFRYLWSQSICQARSIFFLHRLWGDGKKESEYCSSVRKWPHWIIGFTYFSYGIPSGAGAWRIRIEPSTTIPCRNVNHSIRCRLDWNACSHAIPRTGKSRHRIVRSTSRKKIHVDRDQMI